MRWTNDVSVISTAMAEAIDRGDIQEVGNLLARGAPVRARGPEGVTFLHLAAKTGVAPLVRMLLDYEAAVDAVDDAGRTALAIAEAGRWEEAARELLRWGGTRGREAGSERVENGAG